MKSITTNERLRNIHPGEVLQEEFLGPMQLTAYKLAKEIHIPQTRISDIIHGKQRIATDTALRLSHFFGTSTNFWLGLQDAYDLEEKEIKQSSELEKIQQFKYA
jgi:antitoxin HigA-1